MSDFWIAIAVFVAAYALIVSEKIHRTVVALLGACVLIVLKVLPQHEAFHAVDWNVVFLLAAMMIIVNVLVRTGVFEWIALKTVRVAKGKPFAILALLSVVTAVLSAFLDNVTTVLLIAPVTIFVAKELQITPVPYLITEAIASNIGGTATLIGDPPNIMIGSATGLSFNAFFFNLAPVIVVVFIAYVLTLRLFLAKSLHVDPHRMQAVMAMNPSDAIKDAPLLKKAALVMGLVLIGFFTHSALHLEPATIALLGAAVLLLITKIKPHDVFKHVEWPTLFFFVGLFILVEGLVKVGAISQLTQTVLKMTQGNFQATTMVILWFSAFLSAFVDNIPYVATMIPLIKEMIPTIASNMGVAADVVAGPLWWSLALGACLGGNGTLIGASANIIVAGIGEEHHHPITFKAFFKYGFPLMIESIIICHVYLYLRYFF